MKAPVAKLAQLLIEMTLSHFCEFKMSWNVFKQIINIPLNQLGAQFCLMEIHSMQRLNSHYETWSYKKKKHKEIKAYNKSV